LLVVTTSSPELSSQKKSDLGGSANEKGNGGHKERNNFRTLVDDKSQEVIINGMDANGDGHGHECLGNAGTHYSASSTVDTATGGFGLSISVTKMILFGSVGDRFDFKINKALLPCI
jgi:hypothetical protein